jgi:hypothetical protein
MNLRDFVHRKGWLSKDVICEFLDFLVWMLATIRITEIPVGMLIRLHSLFILSFFLCFFHYFILG